MLKAVTSGVAWLLLSAVAGAAPLSQEPGRVIYQVYVRAFYDGSLQPDGEGDFAGLQAKLGYFEDLGVDTLLLMPIFASTGGMGYIPVDYFNLDPAYGNLAQFREFVAAAHARGIKIVLDTPVNHISDTSAWFRRGSQKRCLESDSAHDASDPDNRFCDFFYFVDDPCHEWPYRNWHKPWHYESTDCRAVWFTRRDYDSTVHRPQQFYATFFQVMPDLKFWDFARNAWNEPVVQEIERFFEIWTRHGVDAFRIDAAKHFVEGAASNASGSEPLNLELLARWLRHARRFNPDVSFIAEAWSEYDTIEKFLPSSTDMVLDFPFMEAVRDSVRDGYGERLRTVLRHFAAKQERIPPGQRVVFAGNHDVSRMMTEWGDNESSLRMAHFLALTTPFTPLLYYGEELGMHGRVKRPDSESPEEYVRTINAFPWDGEDPSVGFPGGQWPVTGAPDNYQTRNLERLRGMANSSWQLVRRLLAKRREFAITPATRLYVGEQWYGHVLGFTMVNPAQGGKRATCRTVVVNFDRRHKYTLDIAHVAPECQQASLREVLLDNGARESLGKDAGSVVYELGPFAKIILGD